MQEFGTQFTFGDWTFDARTGVLQLHYQEARLGAFVEQFQFPMVDPDRYLAIKPAVDAAIDCLHWMAGVSYYKTTLAKHIEFSGRLPSETQAKWLTDSWQAGLAELAHEASLGWLDHIQINGQVTTEPLPTVQLSPRSLVAIGGGKDSLVAIEAIKSMAEPAELFVVGQSPLIAAVAAHTGLPLNVIKRQVDPRLSSVNQQGAFNGHVPITAINACVAVVAALLGDFDAVVFANERSANEGNVLADSGQWVNHQYSKSLAYERQWQQIINQHITPKLHCFSLLRPFSELAIVKQFAQYPNYFTHFSSCNRNFHLAGSRNEQQLWCGECPKCAFAFLCLAPFIPRTRLLQIFHQDLLAKTALESLYEALLGLAGDKPFECVGEAAECRLALQMLSEHVDWQAHDELKQWLKRVPKLSAADAAAIMSPSAEHLIPKKRQFSKVVSHVAQ